ncbi:MULTISPECIES: hypothetical protein [Bacillaceae]|uniref:YhfM-like domain-containing protein n=1 Tax=Evansella alkalicola TaxID=745819 RepID=A0ABS6JU91_9BACI|nr:MULTISPECIES: hypothetical protein [Bacillaceae]MBU9721651.1 hypothetical protein [Bacillus alkalicola]
MKKVLLLIFLVFCCVSLIACQSENEEMALLDTIADILISKSNGYGGLNEDYFLSFNQEETISVFEVILKNTKGISQTVDVTNEKPDFDILIRYEDGNNQGLHLSLGNEGEESVITYIGHERNGFIVSAKDTNELRLLLGV